MPTTSFYDLSHLIPFSSWRIMKLFSVQKMDFNIAFSFTLITGHADSLSITC